MEILLKKRILQSPLTVEKLRDLDFISLHIKASLEERKKYISLPFTHNRNIHPTQFPWQVLVDVLCECSNIPHRSRANEVARVIRVRSRLPISNSRYRGSHLVRMMNAVR